MTDASGYTVSAVELDPWGADASASWNQAFQPRKYTSYERDLNGGDEAMFRRYNRKHARFDQPDPYDGSYSLADPQSFNRYAYVQNDPVNLVDPSGLMGNICQDSEGMPVRCPDIGIGGWIVNVYTSWSDTITDSYGADRGVNQTIGMRPLVGPQNRTGPQNPSPEQRGSTRAAELLRDSNDCRNFIAELISIAAGVAGQAWTGQITPSFDPVRDQNGGSTPSYGADYALGRYNTALAGGRVTASGVSGRSRDTTTYGTTTGNNTISWNREFYSLGLVDQALMTLHESLHLIPNFSDFVIAGAAHMMATRGTNNPGNIGSFRDQTAASIYINEQIAAHCRP